jgi:F0F1-type ATP synthase membrane subunit b/b'
MDTIVIILQALKIDKTVLIQFGFLFVFFNLLAPLFFNKIQEILEYRENKTTKLESHAHAVYKQAEELAEQYKAKVEKTHQDSQTTSYKKKSEVLNAERDLLKKAEEQLNTEYEERKSKIVKEVLEKRSVVMADAEKLAGNLVEKLTK